MKRLGLYILLLLPTGLAFSQAYNIKLTWGEELKGCLLDSVNSQHLFVGIPDPLIQGTEKVTIPLNRIKSIHSKSSDLLVSSTTLVGSIIGGVLAVDITILEGEPGALLLPVVLIPTTMAITGGIGYLIGTSLVSDDDLQMLRFSGMNDQEKYMQIQEHLFMNPKRATGDTIQP